LAETGAVPQEWDFSGVTPIAAVAVSSLVEQSVSSESAMMSDLSAKAPMVYWKATTVRIAVVVRLAAAVD